MSNASGPSDFSSPDKSPTPDDGSGDDMEIDDWALDPEEKEALSPQPEATAIPSRRDGGHSVLSTMPAERQGETFVQPLGRERAMMGAEAIEAPAPEPVVLPSFSSIASSLSLPEKIAISALVVILAIGAALSVIYFSNNIPTKSILREDLDLPIAGELAKITELETYWREPITTGETPDIVRRGTKLVPVVRMQIEASSAAIRIHFRDGEGAIIGDPINRTINGNTELIIPATAGFDDIGMHAAYRTGESVPWSIEILEAKDSSLSADQFHPILKSEIAPEIR